MSKKAPDASTTLAGFDPITKKLNWEELPMGSCVDAAGSGAQYQTGDWRSVRPIIDFDNCIQCFFCWVFCPDGSIAIKDQKVVGIDYYHCKGCGICAVECPKKCIAMVDEGAALREDAAAKA